MFPAQNQNDEGKIMLKIQRPAPFYRFAVVTTENHLTIICPGLNISAAPMWKRKAVNAFLELTEDTLLPNSYNSTNETGTRIEIEKLHHNGYYNDYYKAIADAINDIIEEFVQPSKDREEAYKKYKANLESLVNQNKHERI